jgi:hypothetical protein
LYRQPKNARIACRLFPLKQYAVLTVHLSYSNRQFRTKGPGGPDGLSVRPDIGGTKNQGCFLGTTMLMEERKQYSFHSLACYNNLL